MGTPDTDPGEKVRALALAGIMVLSVLVAGVGGSMAATSASGNTLVVDADGEQGSYTKIQPAIDDADPGDTIEVKAGTYEEDVKIDKSLTLTGAGIGESTIVGQGAGKGAVAILSGASAPTSVDDVTITGFTIKQGASGSAVGVETGGTDTAPNANIHIEDNKLVAADGGFAVFAGNLKNSKIKSNTITTASGSASATELVYVGGARTYGSDRASTNVDIVGNTFTGSAQRADGLGGAIEHEAADSEISDNDFTEFSSASGVVVQTFGDGLTVENNQGVPVAVGTERAKTISAGVKLAESGDTIEVASGTYTPSSEILVDKKNLVIRGANADARPTVRADKLGTGSTLFKVRAQGVTIRDLVIKDDVSQAGVAWDIRTKADGLTVDNVRIERMNGQVPGYENPAIVVKNADGAVVKNSHIVNGAVGASIPSDGSITVKGNSFNMPADLPNPIWVTGIDFAALSGNEDITIKNNGAVAEVPQTEKGYYRVFSTISAAFEAPTTNDPVASGGSVVVTDGTYAESVTVDKDVTLRSANGESKTTIVGQSSTTAAVKVTASGATVKGVTVDAANNEFGIDIGVSNVDVRSTTVTGPTSDDSTNADAVGIIVQPPSGEKISGFTFDGVTVKDVTSTGSSTMANGFLFDGDVGSGSLISDVTIKKSTVKNVEGPRGVVGVQTNKVDGLTLKKTDVLGIRGEDSDSETNDNWAQGINVDNTGAVTIKDSTFESSTDKDGYPGSSIKVASNANVDKLTITGNTFLSKIGVNNAAGTEVNAENNYWGSPSGPTADANTYEPKNQGAGIVGPVSFTPWLTGPKGKSFAPVTTASGAKVPSIGAGIAQASAQGTVTLHGGTFGERVTVDKDVTVTNAAGTTPTVVWAPGKVTGKPTINVKAAGATVNGLTVIRESAANRKKNDAHAQGIAVRASDVTISDNRVIGENLDRSLAYNRFDGIVVLDSSSSETTSVTVKKNHVEGFHAGIVVTAFYGSGTSGVDVTTNYVLGNNDGLVVKNHDGGVTDVTATENVFVANADNGVVLPTEYQGYTGLTSATDALTLHRNVIGDNKVGILVEASGTLDATRNWFDQNEIAVKALDGATVDAANSYWGSEDGPSDGQTMGDVTVEPYSEEPIRTGEASLSASPDTAGAGSSTHTYEFTVTSASSVAGHELGFVQLNYANVADAGGSTSSVSDNSNAEVVIYNADGSVQADLSNTDQISVKSSSNLVTVDVTGVDDSRKLSLEKGDRIVVTIHPVTNPSAGSYTVPTGVFGQSRAVGDKADTTLDIQSADTGDGDTGGGAPPSGGGGAPPSDGDDTADEQDDADDEQDGDETDDTEREEIVDAEPDEEGTTVAFQNASVEAVTFANETLANVSENATVSVTDREAPPAGASDPPGETVQMVEIDVPAPAEDNSATVTFRLSDEELAGVGAAPEDLTVVHYDDESGEWEVLETSVEQTDGGVVLTAQAPGFSTFAVTAMDTQESTPTPTPAPEPEDPTPTDEPDEPTDEPEDTTPTDTPSGPGFGVVASVLALLGAALLATRE